MGGSFFNPLALILKVLDAEKLAVVLTRGSYLCTPPPSSWTAGGKLVHVSWTSAWLSSLSPVVLSLSHQTLNLLNSPRLQMVESDFVVTLEQWLFIIVYCHSAVSLNDLFKDVLVRLLSDVRALFLLPQIELDYVETLLFTGRNSTEMFCISDVFYTFPAKLHVKMCQLLVQSLRDAHSRYWNGEDSGELSLQPAVGGCVLLKHRLNPSRVFPVVTAEGSYEQGSDSTLA